MDYKYIEQLLERYWQCETTLEEESILKTFFSQQNIPAELRPYQKLFSDIKSIQECRLGDDFDRKVLDIVNNDTPVKAKRITLSRRLMPLYKAAATVAIILTLGNAAQNSFQSKSQADDYNYDSYQDSYSDPSVAYDHVSNALDMVSQGLCETIKEDSLTQVNKEN